ncbi:endonuclease/exonuclease/phosphatase family protein [Pseudokineococcus basanitobsidens]|uniref:Endonuclease/exonuclease/phosphatase family protein n=1 Tax=Pseudokineococcus basanitobsidens TaxID=1926649 RepID=A0ABU8RJZ3_9ACTN
MTGAEVAACTAVLVAAAALTASRWWDVDPGRPGAPLVVRAQALVPGAGGAALVVLAAALPAGAGALAAAAALLVAVHAALAAPGWSAGAAPSASPGPEQAPTGPRVRLLALNTWYGRADARAAAALLQRLRPDVVALVELTPAGLDRLESAGALEHLPHRAGRAAEGGVGTLLAARWALEEVLADDDLPRRGAVPGVPPAEPASDNPAAVVRVPGGSGLLVRAAHPYYPALGDVRPWRHQLAALERWCRRSTGEATPHLGGQRTAAAAADAVVVLGDLNATTDHPALRRLLLPRGPMRLASRAAGRGRSPTWPVVAPLPGLRGLVALDHVLVHGAQVLRAGTAPLRGTDHRAVWADVLLPGGGDDVARDDVARGAGLDDPSGLDR